MRIRTKEKCPKCSRAFKETRFGLVCPRCKTRPSRYYVDLSWKGKRIRIYSFKNGQSLSSWDLAERAKKLIEHEIETGVFDPSRWVKGEVEKFFFLPLVKDYLEEKENLIKPSALKAKRICLTKIHEYLQISDVREIQSIHIHELVKKLSEQGLETKTVRNYLIELRAFLRWLYERGIIENVPVFPKLKVQEKAIRWIDAETQEKILSFIPQEHRPIFEFLFLTGCRIGEARALQWDQVSLKENYVVISRTFSLSKLVETTKEGKPKVIPLVGRLKEIFEDLAQNKKSMFVFCFRDGRRKKEVYIPYPEKKLQKLFKEAAQKAGVEGITLYQASRHSFAMQLLEQAFPTNRLEQLWVTQTRTPPAVTPACEPRWFLPSSRPNKKSFPFQRPVLVSVTPNSPFYRCRKLRIITENQSRASEKPAILESF